MQRRKGLLLGLGILALTLATYSPVMSADFIWDDDAFLTNNALIQAPDGLYRFWFTTQPPDYFPLTSSMLWVEWRLWGTNAAGYHVVNILLHAASAILLWRMLRRLKAPGAYLAGLIFAVHPVNVESVAWITERKNTLPMAFYLLSVLLYLRRQERHDRRWYFLALGSFLLALLAKTSVVMLPVVLLGCVWWLQRRLTWKDVARTVPFFVLAGVLGLVTVWFQYTRAIGQHVVREDSFLSRLAIAGRAVWFYLYKALLPVSLSFVYPRWTADVGSVLTWAPLAALVLAAAVIWWFRKGWARPLAFGLGYFVVTLLPVLGFLNIYFMQYSLVADHWQYFSLPGLIGLVCGLGGWGYGRLKLAASGKASKAQAPRQAKRGGPPEPPVSAGQTAATQSTLAGGLPVVAGVLVLALMLLSFRQAGIYRNAEAVWLDALAKDPNCFIAHSNLGNIMLDRGQLEPAVEHHRQALLLKSDAIGYNNLGRALEVRGDLEEAIRHYVESLRLDGRQPKVLANMANALLKQRKYEQALELCRQAISLDPKLVQVHWILGMAFLGQDKAAEAVAAFREEISLNPNWAPARQGLGQALLRQGDQAEALAAFRSAIRISPNLPGPHYYLAKALASTGQGAEAVREYDRALRLRPNWPAAAAGAAFVLATDRTPGVGNPEQALQLATAACAVSGDDPEALDALAAAQAALGRFDQAVATAEKALGLALSNSPPPLGGEIRKRLELYKSGRPFIQTKPAETPPDP